MIKLSSKVLVPPIVLRNTKKTKDNLPVMNRVIASHMQLKLEQNNYQLNKCSTGFSGFNLLKLLIQLKKTVMERAKLKVEQQRIAEVERQREIELKNTTTELRSVYNTYIKLAPTPEILNLTIIENQGKIAMQQCITSLKEKIEREEMMRNLELKFTKGASFYKSHSNRYGYEGVDPFSLKNLTDIQPRSNVKYNEEYSRLNAIFIANSAQIDNAITAFNELSKNFQTEAAKSLKEIFNLQSDKTNKWLERIPKLGIIPKVLRITEQVRLSKCIIKDYQDISNEFVEKKLMPLIKKYNLQYDTIRKYAAEHQQEYNKQIEYNKQLIEESHWWQFKDRFKYKKCNKDLKYNQTTDEEITNLYQEKIYDIKKQRQDVAAKSINVFARCGMNINNICKSVQSKGITDIARKAIFTLLPFVS